MNRWTRAVGATVVAVVLGAGLVAVAPTASPAVGAGSALADPVGPTPPGDVTSIQMSSPALSVPVRNLKPGGDGGSVAVAAPQRVNPLADTPDQGASGTRNRVNVPSDPLISGRPSTRAAVRTPATNLVFDGTGNPLGCGSCAPPDTTGDVGPNHYIQMVNATKVAIYSKSGVLLKPAFDLSTLFSSLGGACYANNRGDPQVLYDPLADRWLLSQFAPKGANTLCFAISQTADPLGAYHLYSFATPDFPDYFKVGVWPTGYYVGDNESSYAAYALDRTKMLAGLPATAVRVGGQTNLLMPADVDGSAAPSSGGGLFYTFKSKNYAPHSVPNDRLEVFQLTPDFSAGTATFSTIATLPITPFTFTVCGYMVFACVPQKDTAQQVDSVSEWPMQRFAYRKLADRETLVGNFTVGGGTATPGAAIRWFELGNTGSGWTLRQEGTQDLGDGLNRWMGSIAMDAEGNIALGYSASSASAYPSIRYATRAPTDPLGTLQSERIMVAGTGSQLSVDRWGDYSAMSVDPATDRAFWYTNEYYNPSAPTAWRTAIGRFAYTNQAITFAQPPNTAISTNPVTLSATGGGSGNPVTFASTTPAVCTSGGANGASVTLVALGACTISANQAGNGSYNPAPQVQRTFQVTAAVQKPANRCVTVPVLIPRWGIRRLQAPRCATNAGQLVRVAVTGRLRGDQRYWKVIRKANGAVFIRTYGYRLKLRITWSAPAVGNFAAYLLTRTYRI